MSDAEKLELLAALYADYPDAVPEGWFLITRDYVNGLGIENDEGMEYRPIATVPRWFLTLALGTLREKLEAGRWQQHHDYNYVRKIPCQYEWWHKDGKGRTASRDCPHAAAIAAYRMMKETAHADS